MPTVCQIKCDRNNFCFINSDNYFLPFSFSYFIILLLLFEALLNWWKNAAAFSLIGTVNSVSHFCYYIAKRVLYYVFGLSDMKKKLKWNVSVRSHFKQMSILAITHIFSYIFHVTAATTIRVFTIVKWCYAFFHIHVSDSLISVTHNTPQTTQSSMYVAITFHFLFCTRHFSMTGFASDAEKNSKLK